MAKIDFVVWKCKHCDNNVKENQLWVDDENGDVVHLSCYNKKKAEEENE